VLDFGIAQRATGEQGAKLTQTGMVVGTPAWLSPEAILGEPTDARTDVYGLGAVLYFGLAGRAPFDASNAALILSAHLHDQPVATSERLGSALPADLEAIVLRCLEKAPAARFANARELADALATCGDAGRWTRAEASAAWAAHERMPSGAELDKTLPQGGAPAGE